MRFWEKLKDLVLEKEPEVEQDLVEEVYESFLHVEPKPEKVFGSFVDLEKKPEPEPEPFNYPEKVAVQINGSYEFRLEKNMHGERLKAHGIHVDIFDIFIVFHASLNCTVDEFKLTIPAHYKIHMAGATSEEQAYIKLAKRTEEEEREFIMDELKPRVINDIKEKISEERYKQIKKQVEEKGKVRFDVVMDIDKDKLTK